MKTLLRSLLLFFIAFLALNAGAEEIIEISEHGDYHIKDIEIEWGNVKIKVDPMTRPYKKFFIQAITNPNCVITVEKKEKIQRMVGLFKKMIDVEKKCIMYDTNENKIIFVSLKEKQEKRSFLLLPFLISLLFWALLQFFGKTDRVIVVFAVLFFIATLAAIINSFFYPFFVATIIMVLAFAIIIMAFWALIFANYPQYQKSVNVYYIFIILYFISVFIGL